MTVGVHVCRGNYKGMYLSEGGYDSVAEKFFAAPTSTTSCSSSTRRAPAASRRCASCRRTKGVVLGLVSSKTPQLEKIDALRRRADEAAGIVDASRLAISPQCGFASTMGGNPVTEADERAKLRLCVDAAQEDLG